jgi:hypothetical protein
MPHEDELYVVLQIAEVVPFAKSRLAFEMASLLRL